MSGASFSTKLICILVFSLYATGLVADLFICSPEHVLKFIFIGVLLTIVCNAGQFNKYSKPERNISGVGLFAILTFLLIGVTIGVIPLIFDLNLGSPVRETGLLLEQAPYRITYKHEGQIEVPPFTYYINSLCIMMIPYGGFTCISVFAWNEANRNRQRNRKEKEKRDQRYALRKQRRAEARRQQAENKQEHS
ncbi:MAG: hypothetical protein KDA77_06290 [Planctomycetaceae bacterium]|nr:hypothetical protein [Planctomycetaceae bacterium]